MNRNLLFLVGALFVVAMVLDSGAGLSVDDNTASLVYGAGCSTAAQKSGTELCNVDAGCGHYPQVPGGSGDKNKDSWADRRCVAVGCCTYTGVVGCT
jgi:hypothetical protein